MNLIASVPGVWFLWFLDVEGGSGYGGLSTDGSGGSLFCQGLFLSGNHRDSKANGVCSCAGAWLCQNLAMPFVKLIDIDRGVTK